MRAPIAHEDHLFQQRVVALRSANEVSKWFFLLWIGTNLILGLVGMLAFASGAGLLDTHVRRIEPSPVTRIQP